MQSATEIVSKMTKKQYFPRFYKITARSVLKIFIEVKK